MLAYLYWNPSPDLFTVPYFNHPVKWYGFCFMIGFVFGYYLIMTPLKAYTKNPQKYADRLLWFILAGTLIGARLGHVFFYEPSHYLSHPVDILKIWEGGLASHGGTIGVLLAIFFFRLSTKKESPHFTILRIMDLVAVPTALVAFFIRLGNFFNQEIIGTQTSLPWGVIFGNPFDSALIVPRHPSQMYEGLCYLATFILLYTLQKIPKYQEKGGFIAGLFLTLIFTSRFFIEFTKESQHSFLDTNVLQAGQLLSLPFIALGLILIAYSCRNKTVKA